MLRRNGAQVWLKYQHCLSCCIPGVRLEMPIGHAFHTLGCQANPRNAAYDYSIRHVFRTACDRPSQSSVLLLCDHSASLHPYVLCLCSILLYHVQSTVTLLSLKFLPLNNLSSVHRIYSHCLSWALLLLSEAESSNTVWTAMDLVLRNRVTYH